MICVSAIYPNAPGTRFDGEYYVSKHSPMACALLEQHGLAGIRTMLGVGDMEGGTPPYWAVSEMLFESRAEFDAAMAACGEALFADLPNYTDIAPVLQISRLATD